MRTGCSWPHPLWRRWLCASPPSARPCRDRLCSLCLHHTGAWRKKALLLSLSLSALDSELLRKAASGTRWRASPGAESISSVLTPAGSHSLLHWLGLSSKRMTCYPQWEGRERGDCRAGLPGSTAWAATACCCCNTPGTTCQGTAWWFPRSFVRVYAQELSQVVACQSGNLYQ